MYESIRFIHSIPIHSIRPIHFTFFSIKINLRVIRITVPTIEAKHSAVVAFFLKGSFAVLSDVLCPIRCDGFGTVAKELVVAKFVNHTRNTFTSVVAFLRVVTSFVLVITSHTGPAIRAGAMHTVGTPVQLNIVVGKVRSTHLTWCVGGTIQATRRRRRSCCCCC